MIGAVIMAHGDDGGLILPATHRPYQSFIIPIPRGNWKETILPKAREIRDQLVARGIRVMLDDRDSQTPGWKLPTSGKCAASRCGWRSVRRNLEKSQVVLARRERARNRSCRWRGSPRRSRRCSSRFRKALFERAVQFRTEHTTETDSYDEFKQIHGRPSGVRDLSMVRLRESAKPTSRRRRRRRSATFRSRPSRRPGKSA